MKKHVFCSMLAVVICLSGAQPVVGQDEDGGGGFIDWIHRLSGPSMVGPAVSYYRGWERVRLRITGAYRFPVASEDKIMPGHSLNMLSLQPTIEVPIGGPVEVNAGVSLHRLGGDGHDAVWHLSIPVYGQIRVPVNEEETWFLRLGLGGHYFPSFDEEDFDGGVTVKTDGREISFAAILGLDLRIH